MGATPQSLGHTVRDVPAVYPIWEDTSHCESVGGNENWQKLARAHRLNIALNTTYINVTEWLSQFAGRYVL